MYLIHPRRYYRNVKNKIEIFKLKRQAEKYGVKLQVGSNVRLIECAIRLQEDQKFNNTTLIIGDNCFLKYATFGFWGNNSTINIGNYVHINGGKQARTGFVVGHDSSIIVGEDCLFSANIRFWTTDFHTIFDAKGTRINVNKDIFIDDHVWIGTNVFIGKGAKIPKNTVVGAFSVVTKAFETENVVIAGNPAMIRKNGINWEE